MSMKTAAIEGVLKRVTGGRATRLQALLGAVAAGAGVYKLLRSGTDAGGDGAEKTEGVDENEGAEKNAAAKQDGPA
jgi:hypothetical protein